MIRFLCFFILISSSVMNLRAQESPVLKLSLQEILDLSDKQSHTLKKGNYNIERVENELAASRLQWAPELSLSVSAGYLGNATLTDRDFSNREVVDMPHFSNKLVLQLTQTVYDASMLEEIKQQRTATELAFAQQDVQKQEIRFMLVEWYLSYLKQINEKEVYLNDKARLEKLLSETRERYKQGTALKSDVTNYLLEVKNKELLLTKNANRIRIINYQLAKLLGLPENTMITPDDSFLAGQPDSLRIEADFFSPAQAPQLQESMKQYELSRQKERSVKVKRLPKLFVWGENSLKGPISTAMPPINKNMNDWGLGLGLSFNIGNLYKSGRNIKAASYATQMYKEQTELIQDQLDTELYTARTKLEEALDELAIRRDYKVLASELYEVVYERYSNGMAIVTEMMDAGNELLSADIEYLNMQIETFRYYYMLRKIAGTL